MIGRLKRALPWWAKLGAKVVLSRVPVGGRAWQSLNLFSPGEMLDPDYAIRIFDRHYANAGRPAPGFAFAEIGPGDSLASAVIGHARGAARCWLVDAGAYAAEDISVYRQLIDRLEADIPGFDPASLRAARDRADLLAICNATYLETGLQGLREIPTAACDLVFSQAVLEHIPRGEFADTMAEHRRILKAGGIGSHQIDFRDHLGGGLSNLRFADSLWEAPWFARRSGFYTNRLRPSQVHAAFIQAGFTPETVKENRWDSLPLARQDMDSAFRSCIEDDLLICDRLVRLTPRDGGTDDR